MMLATLHNDQIAVRKKKTIPPSLLAVAIECKRRFWYEYHHIYPSHQPYNKGNHPEIESYEWLRKEVVLPSGTRIDGWISDEKIAVEIKNEPPNIKHIVQVKGIMDELLKHSVMGIEYQLWYLTVYKTKAIELAESLSFDHHENPIGYYAVCLNTPSETEQLQFSHWIESLHWFVQDTRSEMVPAHKNRDPDSCKSCSYHDFCHI